MIVYVVFCKDFKQRKGELMGMLVERRNDMRGQTPMGIWGKMGKEGVWSLGER
jgi:hypothetical protein